ncbi:MAG: PQQ-binding-like beta-propeller repeat protein [Solirubrobacteraceae bacterium]
MVALQAHANCSLSLAWQQAVGPNLQSVSPPTVAGDIVYYGDGIGNTEYAFNAATGAPVWNSGSTIDGSLYAAPLVDNGQLIVPAWDHKLYAFGP